MALPRRGDSVYSARGFTLIELLVVCAILGIVSAMVIGYVFRAKIAANEASAIGTLRALNSGQVAYSSTCGRNSFAPSFLRLVQGDYASPDLNLSPKSGYDFTLTAGTGQAGALDCQNQATQTAYYASGQPVSQLATGRRGFATNQGGSIWQDTTGLPPAEPFAVAGTISPIK